jgi:hypothetical protein
VLNSSTLREQERLLKSMESPYRNEEGLVATLESVIRERNITIIRYEEVIKNLIEANDHYCQAAFILGKVHNRQGNLILGLTLALIAMIIFFISLLGAF